MLDKKTMNAVNKRAKNLRSQFYGMFTKETRDLADAIPFHHSLGPFEVLALYSLYSETQKENEELREELLTVQAYLLE